MSENDKTVDRSGAPQEVAKRYLARVTDLYWKQHDIAAVVAIGKAGIAYSLEQSHLQGLSPEAKTELRSIAKGIAYNVGSFTWPGWDEPGIDPTPEELAFGSECAALNLQLAIELEKPPDRMAMAHWLVGAHALFSGQFEEALRAFQKARAVYSPRDPESIAMDLLHAGYIALTRLCRSSDDREARDQFAAIIANFAARGDKDSTAYRDQLLSAERLVAKVTRTP